MSTRVKMRKALVEALTSDSAKQTKGVRKSRDGAYSLHGLVGKVAAKLDIGHPGTRRDSGVKALQFGDGLTLEFDNGYTVDLIEAGDSGVSFKTIACLIQDWRADRRSVNKAR